MDFLHNLRLREYGKSAQGSKTDFLIPRLRSDDEDVYMKMGITENEGDSVYYGECLVGRFCPELKQADLLALSDEDGFIILQNTAIKGKKSIISSFRAHKNAIFDLTWMTSHSGALNLVTGAGDTVVALWDAETHKRLCVITCHDQSIRTLAAHQEYPGLLASGARDGKICIHDHRYELKYPVNTIVGAHVLPSEKKDVLRKRGFSSRISVADIAFQNEHLLVSGGVTDGLVKVWDLRRTYRADTVKQPLPLHCLPVGATVTSIILQPYSNRLYVSCKNNAIYCFNANNFDEKPVCKFVGHTTSSSLSAYLQCGLSSCGEYLSCGSSTDNFIYIWSTRQSHDIYADNRTEGEVACIKPIATLVEGHTNGIHCTQWTHRPGELKLASLSDDNSHRIWRVGAQQANKADPENPRNTTVGAEGFAVITQPSFFAPKVKQTYNISVNIPVDSCKQGLMNLPSFVLDPCSWKHTCSPRAPKQPTDWLSKLSPLAAKQSSGKVIKVRSKTNIGVKRKSAKKLSAHFQTVLKPPSQQLKLEIA